MQFVEGGGRYFRPLPGSARPGFKKNIMVPMVSAWCQDGVLRAHFQAPPRIAKSAPRDWYFNVFCRAREVLRRVGSSPRSAFPESGRAPQKCGPQAETIEIITSGTTVCNSWGGYFRPLRGSTPLRIYKKYSQKLLFQCFLPSVRVKCSELTFKYLPPPPRIAKQVLPETIISMVSGHALLE